MSVVNTMSAFSLSLRFGTDAAQRMHGPCFLHKEIDVFVNRQNGETCRSEATSAQEDVDLRSSPVGQMLQN